MCKNPTTFILALIILAACKQSANTNKKDKNVDKVTAREIVKETIPKKKDYPLTDSGQLMLHLDSLPRYSFSSQTKEENNQSSSTISLSTFKNKKLFNIPLKLIPTSIGGGFLDYGDDANQDGILPDSIRETFNLVDTATYLASGTLVSATPKFVVVEFGDILVVISYSVEVIDAIRSEAGDGNNHWHVGRTTNIKRDLTLVLHHWYSVQTDSQGDLDYENEYEHWFIDSNGHIKKQQKNHKKNKNG